MREPLDPKQLTGLMLTARHLAQGVYSGTHIAARHGQGGEFYDFRPYAMGDDPAQIDWKRFGRTDRFYVRRHQHQTDLTAHLYLDISASMDFAGPDTNEEAPAVLTKLDYARQLAAAVALLLIQQGDRVALTTFAGEVHAAVPATGTLAGLQRLVSTLENTWAQPGAADLAAVLATRASQAGLVVLVSDFLDEPGGLCRALTGLRAAGADVMLLQILTPAEYNLTDMPPGQATLVDPETNRRTTIDARRSRRSYRRALDAHLDALRRTAASHRIDHHLILTSTAPIEALRRVLTKRASLDAPPVFGSPTDAARRAEPPAKAH